MGPKLLPPASSDGHPVGPHPLVVQSLSSHHVEKCIACDPGDHPRQWTHPPAGSPPRHRNIVLCFDDRAEDIISFFGFSRGATRALAGMIHKVGLLPRCNLEQLPFAYDMYRRDGKEGRELSRIFKKTLSIGIKMKFIGAWDAVNPVGLIEDTLPFADKNTAISFFVHAMSLNECQDMASRFTGP